MEDETLIRNISLLTSGQYKKLKAVDANILDASKNWNNAPRSIKDSLTIHKAKIEIKKFVTTLPL